MRQTSLSLIQKKYLEEINMNELDPNPFLID